MTTEELAWAAGIIDGEGCISIGKTPARSHLKCVSPQYRIVLKVTMGHKPTIDRLREIFGTGSVQVHVKNSDKVNDSYSWLCQAKQTEEVLRIARPYLFTKIEEADLAILFCERKRATRGGRGGGQATDPAILAEREAMYQQMRALKPRNRFRKDL